MIYFLIFLFSSCLLQNGSYMRLVGPYGLKGVGALGIGDEFIVGRTGFSVNRFDFGISEAIGGIPALTAVLVILTGIIGAVTVTPVMNLLRITDWRARGFAVGVAAHGIGTARAFQVNPVAGAYAGIAMALNALLTSLIVPLVVRWLI